MALMISSVYAELSQGWRGREREREFLFYRFLQLGPLNHWIKEGQF